MDSGYIALQIISFLVFCFPCFSFSSLGQVWVETADSGVPSGYPRLRTCTLGHAGGGCLELRFALLRDVCIHDRRQGRPVRVFLLAQLGRLGAGSEVR